MTKSISGSGSVPVTVYNDDGTTESGTISVSITGSVSAPAAATAETTETTEQTQPAATDGAPTA